MPCPSVRSKRAPAGVILPAPIRLGTSVPESAACRTPVRLLTPVPESASRRPPVRLLTPVSPGARLALLALLALLVYSGTACSAVAHVSAVLAADPVVGPASALRLARPALILLRLLVRPAIK